MNEKLAEEKVSGHENEIENKGQDENDEDLDVFVFDNGDDTERQSEKQKSERNEDHISIKNSSDFKKPEEIDIFKGNSEKPITDDEFMVEIENSDEEVLEINKDLLDKKENGVKQSALKNDTDDKNGGESFRASKDSVASTKTDSFNSNLSIKEVEKTSVSYSNPVKHKPEIKENKVQQSYGGLSLKSGLGQKAKAEPKKGPLPNIKSYQKNTKVGNIIDDFDDIGEVGEWVEKSANVNKADSDNDDDDFEGAFDNNNKQSSRKREFKLEEKSASAVLTILNENNQENTRFIATEDKNNQKPKAEKFGIGKTTKKKGGYLSNNLKEKAKYMSLAQGVEPSEDKRQRKEEPEIEEEDKNEGKELEIEIEMDSNNNKASGRSSKYAAANYEEAIPSVKGKENQNNDQIDLNPEIYNKEGTLDEDDWDKISKMTLANVMLTNEKNNTEPILFFEAWKIIKSFDLTKEKKLCVFENNQSFFQKLFGSCTSVKLQGTHLEERDQIFAYAKVPFNDKEEMHFRMLYTVHYLLTKKEKCNRYGSHWVNIGFQGNDPATDLRSFGMLGVLQIIAFLTFHKDLVTAIHAYSLDETYNFPLCVALINMTGFTIKVLRDGKLNRIILQQKSAINALNNFYFASFYKFYRTYRANKFTIRELGSLKETIEAELEKNPQRAIDDFAKGKEKYLKTMTPEKSSSKKD